MKISSKHLKLAGAGAILLFVALAGGGVYLYGEIEKLHTTAAELASTTAMLTEHLAVVAHELDERTGSITSQLSQAQEGVSSIQSQVGNFESSLTTLEKLSKTDPELLQKYSKVFFLNEHYTPERVSEIEKEYLYNENEPEQIHASVRPYLEDLLNEAGSDGIELYVLSAYRSFDEQWALKGVYTVTYGAGTANTFSADQGYSEHQLGTAVDFITTGLGGGLSGFENTAAYEWLLKNAHKHGFTLSYPRENAYYIFEPWHWRFVGVELATYLHNRGKYFYDLEQREIDEYLVEIFD